ncbi:MAG: ATP-binding protein [Tranquillimonas sp.]
MRRFQRAARAVLGGYAGIIVLTAALVASLMLLFWRSHLDGHRTLFQQDAEVARSHLMHQITLAELQLRGAATFTENGREDLIAPFLNEARIRTPFLVDIGTFDTGPDAAGRSFLWGDDAFSGTDPALIEAFQSTFDGAAGRLLAFSGDSFSALFPKLDARHLILAQLDPARDHAAHIPWAVIDLQAAFRMLDMHAADAQPIALEILSDTSSKLFSAGAPITGLSALVPRSTATLDVPVSENMSLRLTMREVHSQLGQVAAMAAGLLSILVIVLALVLLVRRTRMRQEAVLRAALVRAERASEAKSTFLATMSHEVRTPMNGVLGMTELLSRTGLTETQGRYVKQIKSSGAALLTILNDVLDISKMESGMLAIDPIRVKVPELLQEVVAFYHHGAVHKGLNLMLDVSCSVPASAEVDPTRLRQILGNLLSNAIKFTEKGEIVVRATMEGGPAEGVLRLEVSDQGIGIAPADMSKLFERFRQVGEGTNRKFGGTGLGLAICKQLTEAMGGSIDVRSTPGRGTTFIARIALTGCETNAPLARARGIVALVSSSQTMRGILADAARQAQIESVALDTPEDLAELQERLGAGLAGVIFDERQNIHAITNAAGMLAQRDAPPPMTLLLTEQNEHPAYARFDRLLSKPLLRSDLVRCLADLTDRTAGIARSPADPGTAAPRQPWLRLGHRLLLVDDNKVNLMVANEMLAEMGFDVTEARNGALAVEAAETGDFDLILMDCQMPVMDGYAASTRLRELMAAGAVRRVPIVAVTANALKGDRDKCLAAGMDAFLTKPINPSDLHNALAGLADAMGAPAAPDAAATQAAAPAGAADAAAAAGATGSSDAAAPAERAPVARASDAPAVATGGGAPAATPPTPARRTVPLIDWDGYEKARNSVPNFAALIDIFLTDTAEHLETLADLLPFGQVEGCVLPAHTVKSSARLVGAEGLAALAEMLEKRLRTKPDTPIEEFDRLRLRMVEVFGHTRRQLLARTDRADGESTAA